MHDSIIYQQIVWTWIVYTRFIFCFKCEWVYWNLKKFWEINVSIFGNIHLYTDLLSDGHQATLWTKILKWKKKSVNMKNLKWTKKINTQKYHVTMKKLWNNFHYKIFHHKKQLWQNVIILWNMMQHLTFVISKKRTFGFKKFFKKKKWFAFLKQRDILKSKTTTFKKQIFLWISNLKYLQMFSLKKQISDFFVNEIIK